MSTFTRSGVRAANQLRTVRLTRGFTIHAEGSVLVEFGQTRVLCTASVEEKVPGHKKRQRRRLGHSRIRHAARATHTRGDREAARGKQSGRTQEIQRLIGRSLRAVFDLKKLGERTIHLDCDVLQADGGTRTAASPAPTWRPRTRSASLIAAGKLRRRPSPAHVAAVSVGIVQRHAAAGPGVHRGRRPATPT
jgi:ribonuclease PH